MAFVSGVITSFNQKQYILEAVDSLINQVDELIVVDDFSFDSSVRDLIKKFGHLEKFKIIQNNFNEGISRSFNKGILASKGSIILIQGGDDLSVDGRREIQEKIFQDEKNIVLSFSKPIIIDGKGDLFPDSYASDSFINSPDVSNYTKTLLTKGNSICAPSVAFKKEVFIKAGMFKENLDYSQDYLAWVYLSMVGDFHFSLEPFVFYRIHGQNNSRKLNDDEKPLEFARSYELAFGISNFIDSLDVNGLEELFAKFKIKKFDQKSLDFNRIQLKRFIPLNLMRLFYIQDCYTLSEIADGEEYEVIREIIKSQQSSNWSTINNRVHL